MRTCATMHKMHVALQGLGLLWTLLTLLRYQSKTASALAPVAVILCSAVHNYLAERQPARVEGRAARALALARHRLVQAGPIHQHQRHALRQRHAQALVKRQHLRTCFAASIQDQWLSKRSSNGMPRRSENASTCAHGLLPLTMTSGELKHKIKAVACPCASTRARMPLPCLRTRAPAA